MCDWCVQELNTFFIHLLLPMRKCPALRWCFLLNLLINIRHWNEIEWQSSGYVITYVVGNFRYNATLYFRVFRPKYEAMDEVMGHLTYTRKRYNPGEAPEGLDGVDACERGCHGMLHFLPVHLVDSFVHLPSSFAPSPARSLSFETYFRFV